MVTMSASDTERRCTAPKAAVLAESISNTNYVFQNTARGGSGQPQGLKGRVSRITVCHFAKATGKVEVTLVALGLLLTKKLVFARRQYFRISCQEYAGTVASAGPSTAGCPSRGAVTVATRAAWPVVRHISHSAGEHPCR